MYRRPILQCGFVQVKFLEKMDVQITSAMSWKFVSVELSIPCLYLFIQLFSWNFKAFSSWKGDREGGDEELRLRIY